MMNAVNASDSALQEMRELIYLMPIGVVKFRDDGAIDMLNPMATHLLAPIVGVAAIANLYDALRVPCPGLADKVAGFGNDAGAIIDQHRIESHVGQQNVTLSLSVTRMRPGIHMAVLKDVSRLTDMVAYALASADLLVDVDADGIIGWIGGAFKMLPKAKPRELVGTRAAELFAPRDRETLAKALMVIAARGRLPPLFLRLTNAGASGSAVRCVVGGLTLGGARKRFMLTIGPPPTARLAEEPPMKPTRAFCQEAEGWLREGEAGSLGLVDIRGWERAATRLDAGRLTQLKTEISHLAGGAAAETLMIGELAGGRYGVMGGNQAELARLGSALQDLVGQAAPAGRVQVETLSVDLAPGALSVAQSVQALRMALSRFGAQGSRAPGLAGGLVGIIEQASGQKKALALCIAQGGFNLAFQPIVSLHDRAVHHYEALLRPIPHADITAASPQEFVTLVEAVGLSQALDLAVLRRTMAALRQCPAAIAVNISGESIANPDFVRELLTLADGKMVGQLMIELTETSEIQDLQAAATQIKVLRASHLQVCLDDFGAGAASFRYVRDLQCDFVKIDGAYCHAARRTEQGKSIVRAMCDLASSAGARTIAEMIETEEDAALMAEVGVGFGQGWLFGRPGALPEAAVAAPAKVGRWRY